MSGVPKIRGGDLDRVYEAVDSNISGGMVCAPSTTATVSGEPGAKPAASGATNVLGIAATDAITQANRAAAEQSTTSGPGAYPITDVSVGSSTFTIYNHCETLAQYQVGTAVPYNARVKVGTAPGTVTALVEGTDAPGLSIGKCRVIGGMGTGGGVGAIYINV